MKELSKDELIYHLVRMGAEGNSVPARNVQMAVLTQIRRYKASGRTDEADNLNKALMDSGYDALAAVLR